MHPGNCGFIWHQHHWLGNYTITVTANRSGTSVYLVGLWRQDNHSKAPVAILKSKERRLYAILLVLLFLSAAPSDSSCPFSTPPNSIR